MLIAMISATFLYHTVEQASTVVVRVANSVLNVGAVPHNHWHTITEILVSFTDRINMYFCDVIYIFLGLRKNFK